MMTFNDVFDAAIALPETDRLRLFEALWDCLPPELWPLPNKEWISEAQRRSAEFEAGASTASPWPDVKARARQRAGLDA